MAAVQKLALKCVYADDTTETITIDNKNQEVGINPDNKQIIRNFNAQSGGALATKMKSKNGFNWIGIKEATVTTTNRQYIF